MSNQNGAFFERLGMNDKPKGLWLFIKEGKTHPLGLAPLSEYKDLLTPLIETKFTHPISMMWKITNLEKKGILGMILSYYNNLVKSKVFSPGPYGDWIKTSILCIHDEIYLNLDLIGNAAYCKPTLAADLGIFIQDAEEIYFVGIRRGNKPGIGKPALIGGIMNTNKVLDSPAYTILKETLEEANFKLEYLGDSNELRENYRIKKIPVKITGFNKINEKYSVMKTNLHYSGIFKTTNQEINLDGTKRVYIAVAFCVLVSFPQELITDEILKDIFTAGDDAESIFIQKVTKAFVSDGKQGIPSFGLHHHPIIFKEMVDILKKNEKILH